jgi:hypothetical protein
MGKRRGPQVVRGTNGEPIDREFRLLCFALFGSNDRALGVNCHTTRRVFSARSRARRRDKGEHEQKRQDIPTALPRPNLVEVASGNWPPSPARGNPVLNREPGPLTLDFCSVTGIQRRPRSNEAAASRRHRSDDNWSSNAHRPPAETGSAQRPRPDTF